MSQPLAFRPETQDESIFRCASEGQEYRLPDRFEPDDIVIDIGMHVGGFCHAVLKRGAQHVYAFEAEPSNFACASANLAPFGDRVRLFNKAVWRSDRPAERVKFTGSYDLANTGGGGLLFWEGAGGVEKEIEAVAFDDVVRQVTEDGRRRVRLLKIDCEGSEFPILLTAGTLHLIDEIAGEFHELGGPFDTYPIPDRARIDGVPRFTMDVLGLKLQQAGFTVSAIRHPQSHLGLFYATRPRPGPMGLRRLWRRLRSGQG